MNTKNRIADLDILKGIAIFLVVMGHVIGMCIRGIDSCIAFKIIEQLHMPIFFFISGWFSFKIANGKLASPKLGKRFKQLIIPFLVVSSLWIMYFPHSGLKSPLSNNIPQMLTTYWKDGYWFTLALFEIICLYWLIAKINAKRNKTIFTILLSVVIYLLLIFLEPIISIEAENYDPAGIGLLRTFFPIFIFGVICRQNEETFRKIATNSIFFTSALIIGGMTWYYVSYYWEYPNIPQNAMLIIKPLMQFCLMTVIFGLIYKIRETTKNGLKTNYIQKYFIYLGNESLGIYLLHYFFLFPLTILQAPLREMSLAFAITVTVATVIAFIIIALTLGANYVISKNKILSFLILGK